MDEQKGIGFFLEIWKILEEKLENNCPYLIVCGTGPLSTWCQNYIKDNDLKRVTYKGFIDNKIIPLIMVGAKALILPTRWYEGFPMSILEAFSLRIPVIGSKIGNTGSIIKDGELGWTFSVDSKEELIEIISRKDLNMKNSIERVYSEYFSSESNYKQLDDI